PRRRLAHGFLPLQHLPRSAAGPRLRRLGHERPWRVGLPYPGALPLHPLFVGARGQSAIAAPTSALTGHSRLLRAHLARVLAAELRDADTEIVADAFGPIDEQHRDMRRANVLRRFAKQRQPALEMRVAQFGNR